MDVLDLSDWQFHRKNQRLILKVSCVIFITLGLLEVMLSQSPGGPIGRAISGSVRAIPGAAGVFDQFIWVACAALFTSAGDLDIFHVIHPETGVPSLMQGMVLPFVVASDHATCGAYPEATSIRDERAPTGKVLTFT